MTREEAIQVLESMKSEESYNALIDLCNMAIDALSERLCKVTIFVKDGEKFQRMINDAPTVSADARPTGEWIFNTSTSNGKSWNVCSECGESIFHPANFCPNCGARMIPYKAGDSE